MSPKPDRRKGRSGPPEDRRPQTRNLLIAIGSAVAVAAVLFLFALTSPATDETAAGDGNDTITDPAPDVEMVDFDGETLRLSDFEGTPIVLNFWASWCPPCVAEMPDFEIVNQAAGDRIIFLGVNFQDDPNLAASLAAETGVTYRLVRDPQGLIFQEFDGLGMPTTVFVDASGSIRETVTGQLSEAQLRGKIAEHFSLDV